jgi:hypothetical protein
MHSAASSRLSAGRDITRNAMSDAILFVDERSSYFGMVIARGILAGAEHSMGKTCMPLVCVALNER